MPIESYRPSIKPKVSKTGKVVSSEDIENESLLTFDFLCKKPKGFLKPYWDVVNEIKLWIFQQLGNREGYSTQFAAARTKGPKSDEYISSANRIRALIVEWTNLNDRKLNLNLDRRLIIQLVINEILGMSILEPIWRNQKVKEVYVNGPYDIQVESLNGLQRVSGASFMNQAHALEFCTKLLADYNKTLDSTNCIAESRLHDGARFEATHPAICPEGPNIDIRRHDEHFWTISDIVKTGMASKEMLIDLERYIRLGLSTIVSGGTSTGKTTFLSCLTGLIPNNQRILTIEDTLELHVNRNKLLAAPLEARPAGLTGKGAVTIRDLVKTALRLSPQVVIVGETRGSEAQDLCVAANTGHTVFSSVHANSAKDVVGRLEMAISQGGELLGTETLGAIQAAFPIIIEIRKIMVVGGKTQRIVTGIHEIAPHISKNQAGEPSLETYPLWVFTQTGVENNQVKGEWHKVRELSQERIAALPNYKFSKPLTWHQMLELENIPASERMFAQDWEDVNDKPKEESQPPHPQQNTVANGSNQQTPIMAEPAQSSNFAPYPQSQPNQYVQPVKQPPQMNYPAKPVQQPNFMGPRPVVSH